MFHSVQKSFNFSTPFRIRNTCRGHGIDRIFGIIGSLAGLGKNGYVYTGFMAGNREPGDLSEALSKRCSRNDTSHGGLIDRNASTMNSMMIKGRNASTLQWWRVASPVTESRKYLFILSLNTHVERRDYLLFSKQDREAMIFSKYGNGKSLRSIQLDPLFLYWIDRGRKGSIDNLIFPLEIGERNLYRIIKNRALKEGVTRGRFKFLAINEEGEKKKKSARSSVNSQYRARASFAAILLPSLPLSINTFLVCFPTARFPLLRNRSIIPN